MSWKVTTVPEAGLADDASNLSRLCVITVALNGGGAGIAPCCRICIRCRRAFKELKLAVHEESPHTPNREIVARQRIALPQLVILRGLLSLAFQTR
jgi:hypothetical protein